MVSFQQDFFLTLYSSHEIYNEKINKLFNNKSLTQDLSISESEKLIEHLKTFKKQIQNINNTIDDILNVKNKCNIDEKIERELMIKILPIMNVYRALLNEKYTSNYRNLNNNSSNLNERASNINEQD